jgi:hypothetical protein|tara:strand:- start:43 stop:312 length:270 start_codon:yes stop_codon:yes gene_type:complete
MLSSALDGIERCCVKLLIDGTQLEGWELHAARDDFKLGLKYGRQLSRITIYGNKNWQENSAEIGSWFISGEIQYFEDHQNAIAWLQESR